MQAACRLYACVGADGRGRGRDAREEGAGGEGDEGYGPRGEGAGGVLDAEEAREVGLGPGGNERGFGS